MTSSIASYNDAFYHTERSFCSSATQKRWPRNATVGLTFFPAPTPYLLSDRPALIEEQCGAIDRVLGCSAYNSTYETGRWAIEHDEWMMVRAHEREHADPMISHAVTHLHNLSYTAGGRANHSSPHRHRVRSPLRHDELPAVPSDSQLWQGRQRRAAAHKLHSLRRDTKP